MRNNPYLTVILLFWIQTALYIYIDYLNLILPSSEYADLVFPIFFFPIALAAILISFFIEDLSLKKKFRKFSVILLITAIILFAGFTFLTALAGAYHH